MEKTRLPLVTNSPTGPPPSSPVREMYACINTHITVFRRDSVTIALQNTFKIYFNRRRSWYIFNFTDIKENIDCDILMNVCRAHNSLPQILRPSVLIKIDQRQLVSGRHRAGKRKTHMRGKRGRCAADQHQWVRLPSRMFSILQNASVRSVAASASLFITANYLHHITYFYRKTDKSLQSPTKSVAQEVCYQKLMRRVAH